MKTIHSYTFFFAFNSVHKIMYQLEHVIAKTIKNIPNFFNIDKTSNKKINQFHLLLGTEKVTESPATRKFTFMLFTLPYV